MATQVQIDPAGTNSNSLLGETATWTGRITLLWLRRRSLALAATVALGLSAVTVLLIPKSYKSTAQIMPPEQTNGTSSLLALASRSSTLNPLSLLTSGVLGNHSTTALFVSLLQSGTISDHLVERFQLQHVYHKRYRVDAGKRLARNTEIVDDKRSGVITIQVSDHDPHRARELAQAYLDELNKLVRNTSNSSAHQERIFLEQRLEAATADLARAQIALSEYSTKNNTIDLKEQTRAMVDAAARFEGEMVLAQSTLSSLRQIYGDNNVRVRGAEARIAILQRELRRISGFPSVVPMASDRALGQGAEIYPPLRQVPRLAVQYADLYRTVRVQETLFEMLTQQYEAARIEEAKDIPAVKIIDTPGLPERKSFPPRALLVSLMTLAAVASSATWILLSARWNALPVDDSRRMLARDIGRVAQAWRAQIRGSDR
jgi:capsule polysaccharide export protein KpsE/RkpR